MNWMKARDCQVALCYIKDATPAELASSSISTKELLDWAHAWYLVALEARRIAVIFENERKRRLRDYDTPD